MQPNPDRPNSFKWLSHIDYVRLKDVVDGLQVLTDAELKHLTGCPHCLESARLAAQEVIQTRRSAQI